ncbi:hypothetical protein FEM48_Zijuj02G0023700 [Ziziphus jujuba var. spinosa]|uniref:Uncharacterized protein n=1 Tax=Ziziphus jujuba var. spinosa TaxID=714518 RepID=A0A978VT24_ZIZJJ|nr:hypothetical protein FEM48_Zijuj02G0023700 [Ziziphus jujuba var. spinosa]
MDVLQMGQLGFWWRCWRWQSRQLFSSKEFILLVSFSSHVGAFERRRYMNLVVQRARHPELKDHTHSAISCLLPFIQMDLVERAAVIFFNSDITTIERFLFKLVFNQSYGSKVEEADLEFSLRSFLVTLLVAEPLTRALSHGNPLKC